MKQVEEILSEVNMSRRAAYYAGRGETTSDLDGKILEKMFRNIEENNGQEASKGFTNMVAGLYLKTKDLSASTFINTLYNLQSVSWKYSPNVMPKDRSASMAQTASDELNLDGDIAGSLVGMMLMMRGFDKREDDGWTRKSIGQHFLATHAELLQKENLTLLQEDVKNNGQYQRVLKLQPAE